MRKSYFSRAQFAIVTVICSLFIINRHAASQPGPAKPVSFINDVAPILKEHCFACHNSRKMMGKYDMTTFEKFMAGGVSGEQIVPGKSEASEFYNLIVTTEERRMPPRGRGEGVPKDQAAIIDRWIKEGAKIDSGLDPTADLLKELRVRWKPLGPSKSNQNPPSDHESQPIASREESPPEMSGREGDETAKSMKAALVLYRKYCTTCHGDDGRGKELRASMPVLPDLGSREWQEKNSRAQIAVSILEGKGKLMPAFRTRVTEDQARDLAAYVKSFGPDSVQRTNVKTEDFVKQFRELQEEFYDLQRQFKELEKLPPKRQ